MPDALLKGMSILMLEDDFWQAQDAFDQLEKAGAEIVIMTGSISAAISSLERLQVEVGLLDVNILGDCSYDFARILINRGVPVVFLTGYEANMLPDDLAGNPLITKPIDWKLLISNLNNLISRADSG